MHTLQAIMRTKFITVCKILKIVLGLCLGIVIFKIGHHSHDLHFKIVSKGVRWSLLTSPESFNGFFWQIQMYFSPLTVLFKWCHIIQAFFLFWLNVVAVTPVWTAAKSSATGGTRTHWLTLSSEGQHLGGFELLSVTVLQWVTCVCLCIILSSKVHLIHSRYYWMTCHIGARHFKDLPAELWSGGWSILL